MLGQEMKQWWIGLLEWAREFMPLGLLPMRYER
jgi:hypothetical protein